MSLLNIFEANNHLYLVYPHGTFVKYIYWKDEIPKPLSSQFRDIQDDSLMNIISSQNITFIFTDKGLHMRIDSGRSPREHPEIEAILGDSALSLFRRNDGVLLELGNSKNSYRYSDLTVYNESKDRYRGSSSGDFPDDYVFEVSPYQDIISSSGFSVKSYREIVEDDGYDERTDISGHINIFRILVNTKGNLLLDTILEGKRSIRPIEEIKESIFLLRTIQSGYNSQHEKYQLQVYCISMSGNIYSLTLSVETHTVVKAQHQDVEEESVEDDDPFKDYYEDYEETKRTTKSIGDISIDASPLYSEGDALDIVEGSKHTHILLCNRRLLSIDKKDQSRSVRDGPFIKIIRSSALLADKSLVML